MNNYKLKNFLKQDIELIKEYTDILRLVDPIPTKHQLNDLTLRQVTDIKENINNDDAHGLILKHMEGLTDKQIGNMRITRFYGLWNSIIQQLNNLLMGEEKLLTPSNVNLKWEAVEGSKRLAILGVIPMLDSLAGGDPLKYEACYDLPYAIAFQKLVLNRINGDIEHDMNKVQLK